MVAKLTKVQQEVLARLTTEWQPRWMLVLGGVRRPTLDLLVKTGYAEWRRKPHGGIYEFEYRLVQKEAADD